MRWKVYSVIYAALLIGGMFLPLHDALDIFYVIPRLRTHCGSQKMTVAAMQMAEKKVWAQRS